MTNLTDCAVIEVMSDVTLLSESKEALLDACKAVGGQSALARKLGLKSQGSVSGWIAAGRTPSERVLAVEALSGVSRHRLRRDLYPLEEGGLKLGSSLTTSCINA